MPRHCTICTHADRLAIEDALHQQGALLGAIVVYHTARQGGDTCPRTPPREKSGYFAV